MVRRRRKRREDVYTTSYERLSSYPSYRKVEGEPSGKPLRRGDRIRIHITGVDDDGNPVGRARGYTVVVEGESLEPGATVDVEIIDVRGRMARARLVQ